MPYYMGPELTLEERMACFSHMREKERHRIHAHRSRVYRAEADRCVDIATDALAKADVLENVIHEAERRIGRPIIMED